MLFSDLNGYWLLGSSIEMVLTFLMLRVCKLFRYHLVLAYSGLSWIVSAHTDTSFCHQGMGFGGKFARSFGIPDKVLNLLSFFVGI